MPHNPLPPHVADFLAEAAPASLDRLEGAIARQPLLEQRQSDCWQADQDALAAIKEAESVLARVNSAARDAGEKPDARVVQRHTRTIAARKEAREVANAALRQATKVSAGTREAIDRTIRQASQLTQENAQIELLADDDLDGQEPEHTLEVVHDFQARLDEQDADADNAMLPKADVLARALAELSILRERGRLSVTGSGSLRWPTTPIPAMPITGSEVILVPDVEAIVAGVLGPHLEKQVEAAVEQLYAGVDEADQLSNSERRARKAEIAEQRLESELREVQAVFALWSQGRLDVGLRADISPLAVLGVRRWSAGPKRTNHLTVAS